MWLPIASSAEWKPKTRKTSTNETWEEYAMSVYETLLFSSYLEFQTMGKVQKSSDSQHYMKFAGHVS
jgi:hypothetical protein